MKIASILSLAALAALQSASGQVIQVNQGDDLSGPDFVGTINAVQTSLSFNDFYNYGATGFDFGFGGDQKFAKANTITSFFLNSDVDGLGYVLILDAPNVDSGTGNQHQMVLSSSQDLDFLIKDDAPNPNNANTDIYGAPTGTGPFEYSVTQNWGAFSSFQPNDGLIFGSATTPWSLTHTLVNFSDLTSWRILNGDGTDGGFTELAGFTGETDIYPEFYAQFTVVPEPSVIGLMGISGLALIVAMRRYQSRRKTA